MTQPVTELDARFSDPAAVAADSGGFRHEENADAILVLSVKPTKVLAFAKGTFGQTRHRFKQE